MSNANDEITIKNSVASTHVSTKRTRSWSEVWDHFTKDEVQDGEKPTCKCKHCGKKISAARMGGTSHLSRHLRTRCSRYSKVDKSQMILTAKSGTIGSELGNVLSTWKFYQERSRKDLARMIIVHELPFPIVEHEKFRNFVTSL